MHVFLVQLDIQWHDAEANFARVRSLLDRESVPPGSLLILPELFSVGFTMNVDIATEGEPSRSRAFLAELAITRQSYVAGGLATREEGTGKGFNTQIVLGPDGDELASYR
ncbi:MAG: nitrilase-related carbon-nitrogen hydrolase, partial [Verrucomicrobiota bacterium]